VRPATDAAVIPAERPWAREPGSMTPSRAAILMPWSLLPVTRGWRTALARLLHPYPERGGWRALCARRVGSTGLAGPEALV